VAKSDIQSLFFFLTEGRRWNFLKKLVRIKGIDPFDARVAIGSNDTHPHSRFV